MLRILGRCFFLYYNELQASVHWLHGLGIQPWGGLRDEYKTATRQWHEANEELETACLDNLLSIDKSDTDSHE